MKFGDTHHFPYVNKISKKWHKRKNSQHIMLTYVKGYAIIYNVEISLPVFHIILLTELL